MHIVMVLAVDKDMGGMKFTMDIVYSRESGEDLVEAVRQDY
jgi:hypothetical protein